MLLAITHLTVILTRHQPTTDEATTTNAASEVPLIGAPALVIPPKPEPLQLPAQEPVEVSGALPDGWTGREVAGALRAGGWSNKKIARYLGVHPSTVGRWFANDTDQPGEPTGGGTEAEPVSPPADAAPNENEEEPS